MAPSLQVEGYVEPIDIETLGKGQFEFVNEMIGNDIPSEFMSAIEKARKHPCVEGVRPSFGAHDFHIWKVWFPCLAGFPGSD